MKPSHMLQTKFENFKEKYASRYSKEEWEYIEEHFFDNVHNNEIPDLLRQVYAELEIPSSGAIYYRQHFRLLKGLFPLDGNVIEIGSGRIPAFGDMIASEQRRLGKGTITVYEPLLVKLTSRYPNMTLHKEYFDNNTDISDANLLVGIMPCEATETILESAIANDKDFYVAMCGCVHSALSSMSMFGYGTSPEFYQDEVISKAKCLLREYGDKSHLEVTKLKNSPIDYPILYSRRK